MASKAKGNTMDALSLLVDAANAHSSNQQAAEGEGAKQRDSKESRASDKGNGHWAAAAAALQNQRAEMEFREALQRQAFEREALEGEALLQQRAALMAGMANGGISFQDAEYMQQLRLEALVQQHRQETLAQLALTQENNISPDIQALFQMQQLRQAGMFRDQDLLMALGGGYGDPAFEHIAALRAREAQMQAQAHENPLLQLFAQRDRQQKLAALGMQRPGAASPHVGVAPEAVKSAPKVEAGIANKLPDKSVAALAGSKISVLPCRARGMPMDHNAKTAYFVIPEDMKHGAELVCSYGACRNAGTKFRYCVQCSLPVAKRNFFKRHKHAGKIPADRLTDVATKEDDELSSSEGSQSGKKASKPIAKKWDGMKLLQALTAEGAEERGIHEGKAEKAISSGEMAQLVETRKKQWEALLGKRPRTNDERPMLDWVKKVLSVSDLVKSETKANGKVEISKASVAVTSIETGESSATADSIKTEEVPKSKDVPVNEEKPKKEEEKGIVDEDDNADASSIEKDVEEKEGDDGHMSDVSSSSSDGSLDLRAHKKSKTGE